MSSSMRCRSGLTDCWMDGSDIGSSSRAEGDPSCSEPDPDPLNLSSAHCWRCPLPRPRHPPAERVRAWAHCRHSRTSLIWHSVGRNAASAIASASRSSVSVSWSTPCRRRPEGKTTNDLFAFLTTEPNKEVGAIHPKAMPVILTTQEEIDLWLTAPAEEALKMH